SVLFVGTKRQAQEAIAEQATRVSMPYVNHRWLGGMLTNFSNVHKRLQRLKDLEAMEQSGEFEGRTKKEVLLMTREKDKLAKTLGGIRDMAKVPSAVWIVDTKKEHIAVGEARKLNIPVVAVLDTNCDPDEVDFPIPGNDDAIRSAALLTKVVAEAVAAGLLARSGGGTVATGEEPLAEWERELLASGEAAPAAADGAVAAESPAPTAAEPTAAEPTAAEPAAAVTEAATAPTAAATAATAAAAPAVLAVTDQAAVALDEVQQDAAEGVAEVVPNEQSGQA
ncbi:MAG: 30S ribosomal protein S2, partial [Nakamurella sp.]